MFGALALAASGCSRSEAPAEPQEVYSGPSVAGTHNGYNNEKVVIRGLDPKNLNANNPMVLLYLIDDNY